jgi:hypothetical protein
MQILRIIKRTECESLSFFNTWLRLIVKLARDLFSMDKVIMEIFKIDDMSKIPSMTMAIIDIVEQGEERL